MTKRNVSEPKSAMTALEMQPAPPPSPQPSMRRWIIWTLVVLGALGLFIWGPMVLRPAGVVVSSAANRWVELFAREPEPAAQEPGAKYVGLLPEAPLVASLEGQLVVDGGESQQLASANAEGFVGPTTADAKEALGLDVQRLRTEASSFVWRSVPNAVSAICPNGWVCTLHLASGEIKVFLGDGTKYQIVAGTFRNVESKAYPAGDAVYGVPPCELLAKEQAFGASEIPSFSVSAGNFTCVGTADQGVGDTGGDVVAACPTSPAEVGKLLGGNARSWSTRDEWNGQGWKYGPGAPGAVLTAPDFGRVDYALEGWAVRLWRD